MIWTCPSCNRTYPSDGGNIRCICHCQKAIEVSQRDDYLPCLHRGEVIEEINCGCNGKPKIYSCDIHKKCYLRKIPKIPPNSIANANMCLLCDDRKRFKTGRLGIAGVVHNQIGGTETYWQLLAKTIGVTGFALPETPISKSPYYPVFEGDAALEELSSKVDYLIVWGIVDKAKQTEGPIRIAMHHGSLASTWANTVFENELQWCEKAIAINPTVAEYYKVPCIENCIDTDYFSSVKRNIKDKVILWLHRNALEKRPELLIKIAAELPDGWRVVASLPENMSSKNLECIGYTNNKAEWLNKASVFISTADQEGFGYSVAEAMAAGIPVVSAPVGICINPNICEQVATDDPSDWVKAIIKAGSKVDYAKEFIKNNYDLKRWTEQWERFMTNKSQPSNKIDTSEGPGTELTKLLSWFAKDTPGCKCKDRAHIMDIWGVQGCRNNIETILDWLEEAAKQRSLPFVRALAKSLVNLAINRAESCTPKDASSST